MQWRTDMLHLGVEQFIYSEISETTRFRATLFKNGSAPTICKEERFEHTDMLTGQKVPGKWIWVPDIEYRHKGVLGVDLDTELEPLTVLLRMLKAQNLK